MCAALAASGSTDEGWVTTFQNSWLKIDKKEVEPAVKKQKNEIYLRGFIYAYVYVCLHLGIYTCVGM